jgi:DNA replication protein DnaC
MDKGYEGIDIFRKRYTICMDDIGSESDQIKHYGNDLDVVGYILAERYARRLMTFGTTNYKTEFLIERYGERIVSRMYSLFNFITMKGQDFRKLSHKQL